MQIINWLVKVYSKETIVASIVRSKKYLLFDWSNFAKVPLAKHSKNGSTPEIIHAKRMKFKSTEIKSGKYKYDRVENT